MTLDEYQTLLLFHVFVNNVDPDFKYVSGDALGSVYVHIEKPERIGGLWYSKHEKQLTKLEPNENWDESMMEIL